MTRGMIELEGPSTPPFFFLSSLTAHCIFIDYFYERAPLLSSLILGCRDELIQAPLNALSLRNDPFRKPSLGLEARLERLETKEEAAEFVTDVVLPPPRLLSEEKTMLIFWFLSPRGFATSSFRKLPVGSSMAMASASISHHPAATAVAAMLSTAAEGISTEELAVDGFEGRLGSPKELRGVLQAADR